MAVQIASDRPYPRWTNWSGFTHSPGRLSPVPSSGSSITIQALPGARGVKQWSLESRTVSGWDFPLRIWAGTLADEVVTTQAYLWSEAAPGLKELRPANQRALALLDQWMSEPDELGSAWWESFEAELKQHRLVFPEE